MRADRLISIILLLQTHKRLTARQLAQELGVTPRTIYRDVVDMSAAGIPVYTQDGYGGGISLVEEYRTSLTGLGFEEVRALSMLGVPEPLVRLGVAPALQTALLKLSASLPEAVRIQGEKVKQKVLLDAGWWLQADDPVPCLQILADAIWQERMLHISYQSFYEAVVEMDLIPYGLVAKANVWYCVGEGAEQVRVLRVSHIRTASLLEAHAIPPQDFDLSTFWAGWCQDFESRQSFFQVRLRISPRLAGELPRVFSRRGQAVLDRDSDPDPAGWYHLTVAFENLEAARARLLSLGGEVEVLQPLALRLSLRDFAEQIIAVYAS